ncbi:Hypothetical_protein [Hexamita inflata]|uniref:Hypothetical_protein n=1 Tax=Hexamita inflata TaxID=28002 RepID=A0AA86TNC1_9EUKA|nr:Hypothetical protein HINF_LOCUS10200 [Hexamita inflata]
MLTDSKILHWTVLAFSLLLALSCIIFWFASKTYWIDGFFRMLFIVIACILMKCSIGIRSITIIKTNFPIGARRHKRSITLYQTVNQSITFPTHDHKLIPNPFYPKRNLFSVYVCLNILV